MIKLLRIDDRLVHGQVAFTWVPSLGVDTLLVANDKVARDDFQKMTMGLAKPAGTKLLIKPVSEAMLFLNDDKNKSAKVLILVNSVKDAFAICNGAEEIRSVNFGGLRVRDGATLVSKAVALTNEDKELVAELLRRGLELEVRQVPSDAKQKLGDLISQQ
ncbi:PTS sugar transporter subunit IIB [Chryseolinea sp. T2]|uniref:PTS sugar transporter subunit IIB n=1 Tax=Chryseolinea sp. T2 TaxID=3129255 RepID=UPI0030770649